MSDAARRRVGAGAALIVLLMLAAVASSRCGAQTLGDRPGTPDTTLAPAAPPIPDLLSLGIEFIPTPGSGSFFDDYKLLGGTTRTLDATHALVAALRLSLSDQWRVCLSGAYTTVSFVDIYGVSDSTPGQSRPGFASLVEEFHASAIPVMVGIEYAPVRTQFTTYAGLAAGLAFSTVEWQTTTREVTIGDYARPGQNVRSDGFGPAGRVYAGIDYRFDRNFKGQGAIRGIYLEGSYLFLPLVRDYFALVRHQGKGIRNLPASDSGLLNVGGFSFTIGLNLQFVRR